LLYQVLARARIVGEGGSAKDAAMKDMDSPEKLDRAMLERQCQEEMGALAEFWLTRLPADADEKLLADLRSLRLLAPPPTA
jgi:hypothetical protein